MVDVGGGLGIATLSLLRSLEASVPSGGGVPEGMKFVVQDLGAVAERAKEVCPSLSSF